MYGICKDDSLHKAAVYRTNSRIVLPCVPWSVLLFVHWAEVKPSHHAESLL